MFLTIALTASLALLASDPPTEPSETAAVRELTRLEEVWNQSHLRGDLPALEALWADDLVLIVPGMRALSKADAVEMWQSVKVEFTRYETSDLQIRVYRDSAVVTGRLQRSRDFGGRTAEEDWRFTKVYVRSDDRWRVVSFHASERES